MRQRWRVLQQLYSPKKEASEADTPMYNDLLDRFRRECFLIAQLRHDHIVTVYDTGEYEGMAYLVMQYLEGGTLREKIQRLKRGEEADPNDHVPWKPAGRKEGC